MVAVIIFICLSRTMVSAPCLQKKMYSSILELRDVLVQPQSSIWENYQVPERLRDLPEVPHRVSELKSKGFHSLLKWLLTDAPTSRF